MPLATVVLAALCTNWTGICPGDEDFSTGHSDLRKHRLAELAEQVKDEIFKVTTTETEPISYTEMQNNTLVGMGSAFDFLKIIQEKYGFKYDMIKPGKPTLDLDGGGVLTQLLNGEVDIVAALLPVISGFQGKVEYSRSLDEGEWVVLMKRPGESATGSGLWAPFTFDVWILILVSLICVGPVIYVLIWFRARLCKDDDPPVYPLPQCIWFVYGALLKQGSTISPITDSARLLFATWWIFITILTAFYTANLTAFLTLSKFTLPIESIDDIATKRSPWISHVGGGMEESVKQIAEYQELFQKTKYQYVDENPDYILDEWVMKRKYMYIGERPTVEYMMYEDYMYRTSSDIPENQRCNYVITKWNVMTIPRAFAYKNNFKYYELFDEQIQHLVESGIIRYKLREKLPNTPICPLDLGSTERQLRNADLIMTYVIVAAGFIISAVVFIAEQIYVHLMKREMALAAPKFQNVMHDNNNKDGANVFMQRRHKNNFKFADFNDNNHVNGKLWHEMDGAPPPPPPYHQLFNPPFANSPNGVKKTINGRDYWVVNSVFGESKLIPVRNTPSALLFQYTK